MSDLPPELTSTIFECLELTDVRRCNQVCRYWREVIAANPNFQRELWLRSDTPVEIGKFHRPPDHPYFMRPMPIQVNPNILHVTDIWMTREQRVSLRMAGWGCFPTSLKNPDSRMEQYLTEPRVNRVQAYFPVVLPYGKEHKLDYNEMIKVVQARDGVKLKHLVMAFEKLAELVERRNIKLKISWLDTQLEFGKVVVVHRE